MTFALLIAAVAVSLGVSATCSLLEAALLSLTPGKITDLKRRSPKAGEIWEGFKADVQRPISVILICNTAAHTIGATVAGAEFERLMERHYNTGGWPIFVFGAVFTVLMLQFTEILPKTMGVRHNTFIARLSARPMQLLVRAMGPVLAVVRLVNRPFEFKGDDATPRAAIDEIAGLARMAHRSQVIDAQQEQMIRAAGTLGDVPVREVTTHRRDVEVLPLDIPFATLLKTLRDSAYTRFPVVNGSLDDVRGVVHLRDVYRLLALSPGRIHVAPDPDRPGELMAIPADRPGGDLHAIGAGTLDLASILRPIPSVPDSLPIKTALKQFQLGRSHMALVIGERGTVEGIVTLEDVLEELVGEIEDEFDHDADGDMPADAMRQAGDGWVCRGEVPLRRVSAELDLPDDVFADAQVSTLGGFLVRTFGRCPEAGESTAIAGWHATVEEADECRVLRVTLIPTPSPEAEG